jgi:nitroreductase
MCGGAAGSITTGPSADLVRVDSGRIGARATAALEQRWISSGAVISSLRPWAHHRPSSERGGNTSIWRSDTSQNVYLQAAALRVATVFVGAFRDSAVARVLELPATVRPLGLMPLGRMP